MHKEVHCVLWAGKRSTVPKENWIEHVGHCGGG